jgi:hypothetical protein
VERRPRLAREPVFGPDGEDLVEARAVSRHKHAERTVATFAVVIIVSGIVGLARHLAAGWEAIVIGTAMLVVTEWVVWRR